MLSPDAPTNDLYLSGLPSTVTDPQVKEWLGAGVVECRVLPPTLQGQMTRDALVRCMTIVASMELKGKLHGALMPGLGTPLQCQFYNVTGNVLASAAAMQAYGGQAAPAVASTAAPGSQDNLYVKGLPMGADQQLIIEIFKPLGAITQVKVLPPRPGQEEIHALVRCASHQQAIFVKQNSDGKILQGCTKPLIVAFAQNQTPAPKPPPALNNFQQRPGTQGEIPCADLYVSGLPLGITDELLKAVFGPTVSGKVLPGTPGQMTANALVRFNSVEDAKSVRDNYDGVTPQGFTSPIMIRYMPGGGVPSVEGMMAAPVGAAGPAAAPGPRASAGSSEPNDNLYIKGLPGDADSNFVTQLFKQYGTVTRCKVLDSRPGQMEVHALVQFASVDEAVKVKEAADGQPVPGTSKPLVIMFAQNKTAPPPLRPSTPAPRLPKEAWQMVKVDPNEEAAPSADLLVTELPPGATEDFLRSIFGAAVLKCRVLQNKSGGTGSQRALVRFTGLDEAKKVREQMDGTTPAATVASPLRIRFHGPPASLLAAKGSGKGKNGTPTLPRPKEPSDSLYVKGLPLGVNEDFVREAFQAFGTVLQVKVLFGREGQSESHALLRIGSVEEAKYVKESTDGSMLEGSMKPIKVDYSMGKPFAHLTNSGSGVKQSTVPMTSVLSDVAALGIFPQQENASDDSFLHISGLPEDCTDVQAYQLLSPFGSIPPDGIRLEYTGGKCEVSARFVDPGSLSFAASTLDGYKTADGIELATCTKNGAW